MKDRLKGFNDRQVQIFNEFSIKNKYFLKVDLKSNWQVDEIDGVYFLKYWNKSKEETNVVVKEGSKPVISRKNDYTMVVVVDCIKIAIVLDNKNKK